LTIGDTPERAAGRLCVEIGLDFFRSGAYVYSVFGG
jgi:hypothetical protein